MTYGGSRSLVLYELRLIKYIIGCYLDSIVTVDLYDLVYH